MILPTLGKLFPEQRTIYDHKIDQPLFVAGPPGSGKTSLAVMRAMFLVNQSQSVVVVTRNRMLAALADHLGGDVVYNATTMHALVAQDYANRFKEEVPQPSQRFRFDWESVIKRYAASSATPRYNQIIVDEGQNLPPRFFEWARRFGGDVLTVFADENQASHDETSTLEQISTNGNLSSAKRLTHNHRNTPEIAALAAHFHSSSRLPPATVVKGGGGETPRLLAVSSWDDLAGRIAKRLTNRSESIGVIVRAKAETAVVYQKVKALLGSGYRVDYYTGDRVRGVEHGIRILDAGVTVLTGEAVIGLEFETVYLTDLIRSLPCRTPSQQRRMYMLCARAQKALYLVDGVPRSLTAEEKASLPRPPLLEL